MKADADIVYKKAQEYWDKIFKSIQDAIWRSTKITRKDFDIYIGPVNSPAPDQDTQ